MILQSFFFLFSLELFSTLKSCISNCFYTNRIPTLSKKRNYKVRIVSCKTIRDKNKIALSSRNFLSNKSNLNVAANVYKKLSNIKKNIKNKKNILNFLNLKKTELKNNFKINSLSIYGQHKATNCFELRRNQNASKVDHRLRLSVSLRD